MAREAADAFARGDRNPFAGRGLFSSLFGGFRDADDPFDDPFFTRPFGSLFGSSNMFQTETSDPSSGTANRAAASSANRPVIKELNSDGEEQEEEDEEIDGDAKDKESQLTEKKGSDAVRRSEGQKMDEEKQQQVKSQSFCYRKVTYGGVDGVYRTSTVSRRTASDGVILEESKAADRTTGQAEHRISRGIQNKGHSVTRMLKPDGKVETMQTLHNLNEDELAGFEESWKGNATKQVGQWKNKEEKKHYYPDAARERWDRNSLNLDKTKSPVGASTSFYNRGKTSSGNSGAKKVVRIPIE